MKEAGALAGAGGGAERRGATGRSGGVGAEAGRQCEGFRLAAAGSGGMLDRIDALLLAAPVLWYAQLVQHSF